MKEFNKKNLKKAKPRTILIWDEARKGIILKRKFNKKGGLFKYLFWIFIGMAIGIYIGYKAFNG